MIYTDFYQCRSYGSEWPKRLLADLPKAVQLIEQQDYFIEKAAITVGIPFSSLQERYRKNLP